MRVPNESLDDFNSSAAQPKAVGPPPAVSLRLSGDIEVLKPLASCQDFVKSEPAAGGALVRPALHRLSWFHRSLAVVGGLAIITFLLSISFYNAIYGPPVEHAENPSDTVASQDEMAMDRQPADILTLPEELDDSASLPAVDSLSAFEDFPAVRKVARLRYARARVLRAAYRRRHTRRPQLFVTEFVPTTLVIYAENGEIKTRIEPQLTAGYNNPLPLPN
jgi:hypothetical protein